MRRIREIMNMPQPQIGTPNIILIIQKTATNIPKVKYVAEEPIASLNLVIVIRYCQCYKHFQQVDCSE